MPGTALYVTVGALVVTVVYLGFSVLREESKPAGIELRLDESGVSV